MMASKLLGFGLLITICQYVGAHPWGAPETSCNSMFPLHKRPPQSSPCPFKAHPQKTEIFSNSSLQVTLQLDLNTLLGSSAESSRSSGSHESDIEDFKGYMIMAFDKTNDSVAIGSFVTFDGSHTINCQGGYKNAATHSSKSHKSSVKVLWTPPADFEGEVIFKTTFVSSKKYFWLKQVSSPVVVKLGDQPAKTSIIDQQDETKGQELLSVEEYEVEIMEIREHSKLEYYMNQLNNYLSLWVFCSGLVIVFSLAVAVKLLVHCRTRKYDTLESQS